MMDTGMPPASADAATLISNFACASVIVGVLLLASIPADALLMLLLVVLLLPLSLWMSLLPLLQRWALKR
jgi:hypothetical protein